MKLAKLMLKHKVEPATALRILAEVEDTKVDVIGAVVSPFVVMGKVAQGMANAGAKAVADATAPDKPADYAGN